MGYHWRLYIYAVDIFNAVRQTGVVTKPPTRRGRPRKGAPILTSAAIVEATLKIIDTDGINAVSIRAVGRLLGVDPKSLYNHIDGIDGLLDAVAEQVLGAIALPVLTGDTATDLRAVAHAFRDAALLHPEAASLVLTRQLASLEALAPVQALLQILRDAGAAPGEAVHLLRTLVAAVIGALLREVNAGPTYGTTDPAEIARREAALRESRLPAVIEAAAHLARFDAATEYEYVISLAIDAVTARVSP